MQKTKLCEGEKLQIWQKSRKRKNAFSSSVAFFIDFNLLMHILKGVYYHDLFDPFNKPIPIIYPRAKIVSGPP